MDVRCPNCGTSFIVGDGTHSCNTTNIEGIAYATPSIIRNENVNNEREVSTMNNTNMNFSMEDLARAVAGFMQVNTVQPVTTTQITENTSEPVSPFAKTSQFYNKIMADGHIFNPYLVRRWLPAQFRRMMRANINVNATIRKFEYMYQIDWLKTEVRKLAMLSKVDRIAFDERKMFVDSEVIIGIINNYVNEAITYLDRTIPSANGKIFVIGKSIKKGTYKDIVVDGKITKEFKPSPDYNHIIKTQKDLLDKVNKCFEKRWYNGDIKTYVNYVKLDKILDSFDFIKIHNRKQNGRKTNTYNVCSTFVEAYKKAGAYYTLKNIILFDNALLSMNNFKASNATEGEAKLKELIELPGYVIYAILKKTFEDNNIDY